MSSSTSKLQEVVSSAFIQEKVHEIALRQFPPKKFPSEWTQKQKKSKAGLKGITQATWKLAAKNKL